MKPFLAMLAFIPALALAGGEMKKVCHTEKKAGKPVEVCKTIKVHKKLEGTAIPVKK